MLLAKYIKTRIFKLLSISNINIRLPNNIRIFLNDEATLKINLPDHYQRKEYIRHPDYVPGRGWVVLDVGAHVGVYTLWASRMVGDGGFVAAFEPNPLAYRWLVNNLELNGVKNVKALPYALGDSRGKLTLYVASANLGASSLLKNHLAVGGWAVAISFTIPVLTLDYVFERSATLAGRHLYRVDLAKIDVEGYEMRVLKGAEKSLREGLIERFVIEVHLDQVGTRELVTYLAAYGYSLDKVVRFDRVKDVAYLRLKR
jgi:FkbM family methyltransferase